MVGEPVCKIKSDILKQTKSTSWRQICASTCIEIISNTKKYINWKFRFNLYITIIVGQIKPKCSKIYNTSGVISILIRWLLKKSNFLTGNFYVIEANNLVVWYVQMS